MRTKVRNTSARKQGEEETRELGSMRENVEIWALGNKESKEHEDMKTRGLVKM